MRYIVIFFLFLVSFTGFSQSDTNITLSSNWRFSIGKSQLWYCAEVPGSIYNDLLRNNLIKDPFLGSNEKNCQWIGDSVWNYKYTLYLRKGDLLNQHVELVFEGLDTYSKVWVNDSLIIVTDNMFRIWRKDIKKYLVPGINEIMIQFDPVSKVAKNEASEIPYVLSNEERVFVRKAQFQFGWDFAPRFLAGGIWKPVKIIGWNNFKVENIQVVQNIVTEKVAQLSAIVEINSVENSNLKIRVSDENNGKQYTISNQKIVKGVNKLKINFYIDSPKLWWCNGMGEANLYRLKILVADDSKKEIMKDVNVGLRTIKVVQKPDSCGKSFYFTLNGVPVFAKGANYISANYFSSQNDSITYSKIISNAVESNMNMLRVWGGGIYEKDLFYDLCDQQGILVWQDFMFACAMYPGDSLFIENVKLEAKENVIRLRNHPCIALWCGNNEISEGWNNWGWQKQYKYSATDSIKIWNDYQKLFENILPEIVSKYDEKRFYWSSSPSFGWGKKESLQTGDCHYWGIWWGMEPFENYNNKVGRFMSEYGFQGMPAMNSVKNFISEKEITPESKELNSHQKHPTGFETIDKYMLQEYSKPINFEDFIFKSQLLQSDAIKIAIDAHRRAKPYCMGTLYWQLNDCWPSVSWSGIDYYGRWKAMQYMVKREYKNTLVSIVEKGDSLLIYVISDEKSQQTKQLRMKLLTFDGKVFWTSEIPLTVKASSSIIVSKISIKEIIKNENKDKIVFVAGFTDQPKQDLQTHFFAKSMNLLLKPTEIVVDFKETDQGNYISIKSNNLVKQLCIMFNGDDGLFDDNYFDVIPGETYFIRCKYSYSKNELLTGIKIKYLTN